ncbi:hypothetical protein [Clostridium sp. YIM B02555]|uniref:prenylated flavin chaperone LpdD n=1 Tax=Clostridium sp. YIM B02555 TaxID=2911968 RepID=UPI001EEDB55B|nr:hypothetical protein [Clostridium sp. YIM B02555]
MIKINRERNRVEINMIAIPMGKDICIIVTGGDTPHLGAVTTGSRISTNETFTFPNHKEGIITKMLGEILNKEYVGSFVLCCGIHLDNITKQEISDARNLCSEMIIELCEQLKMIV